MAVSLDWTQSGDGFISADCGIEENIRPITQDGVSSGIMGDPEGELYPSLFLHTQLFTTHRFSSIRLGIITIAR
jgi:hypothetical protein